MSNIMIDNDKLTQQISSISNSEIENYNIQDEIYKFTESVNSEILKYNDKIFAKNQSELLSLLTMIKDYKAPIQFGNNVTLPKMWFDNPTLKQYATDKFQEFETLTNPETNTKLQATNIVDSNLTKVKDLLSQSGVEQNTLDAIKSVEDLANNISLPDNFNVDSLKDLMKTPNLNIPSLESLAEKLNIPDFKIDVISSAVLGTRFGLNSHCQEGSFFRVLEYGPTERWHCDADIRPVAFRSAENREKTLTICSLAAEFTTDFVGNDYRGPKSKRKTVTDIKAIFFCQEMVESILSQKKLFLTDTNDYSMVANAVDSTSMANFNCPVLSIVEGSKMVALMKIASQMNTQSSNYFAQPNLGQPKSSMDIPWMMLTRVASALT